MVTTFQLNLWTIPLVVHFLCKYIWPKVPQQTTFGGAVADDVVDSSVEPGDRVVLEDWIACLAGVSRLAHYKCRWQLISIDNCLSITTAAAGTLIKRPAVD